MSGLGDLLTLTSPGGSFADFLAGVDAIGCGPVEQPVGSSKYWLRCPQVCALLVVTDRS